MTRTDSGSESASTTSAWPTSADLGGQRGHGTVQPESEGALWHADWEPRAMALTLAAGGTGTWNIDQSRAARETLPQYARCSYYEIWILALSKLLVEHGLVGADELAAGHMLHAARSVKRVLHAADVNDVLARGSPTERPAEDAAPRFAVGDRVRTRAGAVPHHTRLPGYARGKVGVVEAVHGNHVFADAHAQGLGEQPCWLYTVVFSGTELWGDAEPGAPDLGVSIDAFEPYLAPVS